MVGEGWSDAATGQGFVTTPEAERRTWTLRESMVLLTA